jgi:hypothetical protein
MIVMVTLILTTGGVILLRPISRRLGELLHALAQEKLAPSERKELAQVRELVSTVESRLSLLEERQNFTEALLDSDDRRARLPSGGVAIPAPLSTRREKAEANS